MTVAELKQALSKYPDDMEVKTGNVPMLTLVTDIITITDIDTNIKSLLMCGGEDWWFKEKKRYAIQF